MSSYSDLLKDPRWQRKRLELLQAADWKCVRCERSDLELQIHHHIYRKGKMPWEYEDHDFSVLFEPHHREVTEYRARLMDAIAIYEKHELPMMTVIGFVDALNAMATDRHLFLVTTESVTGAAHAIGVKPDYVRQFIDIGSGKLDPGEVILAKAMDDHACEGSA